MKLSTFTNQDILKGEWQQLHGSLQKQWGKLTNDDMQQIEGNYEQLVGKLRAGYGYSRRDAEQRIDAYVNNWKLNDPVNQKAGINGAVSNGIANLNEVVANATASVAETASNVQENVSSVSATVSDKAHETAQAVQESAISVGTTVDKTVKKRRWPLLLLTLVIGIATGYALGSK